MTDLEEKGGQEDSREEDTVEISDDEHFSVCKGK